MPVEVGDGVAVEDGEAELEAVAVDVVVVDAVGDEVAPGGLVTVPAEFPPA